MKRMAALLIALLAFVLVPALPASAAEFDLVADGAGLLSDDEYGELNDLAWEITEEYQCEVSIIVIEDMGDDDPIDFAKYLYREYDYGYGKDKSGVMLFLSMKERDLALIAYGWGNTAFTDHGKDVLLDRHVLPLLAKDNYYAAFLMYMQKASEYMELAAGGAPFDTSNDAVYQRETERIVFWIKLAVAILAPLLVAGLICFIFLRQMKTAVAQRAAEPYIPEGGFVLTSQKDALMFTTETRTTIEKKKSGGTTVDRDGFSGTKRKF